MDEKLLTKAEAEMVYTAMCALNNVSGKLSATFDSVRIVETEQGVTILDDVRLHRREHYDSQAEFATEYGLAA